MPTTTKTEAVMALLPSRDQDAERRVTFVLADDVTGVIRRTVLLDYATWQDLGEPQQITVTITPGDQLNEEMT